MYIYSYIRACAHMYLLAYMFIGGSHSVPGEDDSILMDRQGIYKCFITQKCVLNVNNLLTYETSC